jgi:hypothetical protein
VATRWQGRIERDEHGNHCDDNDISIDDFVLAETGNSINDSNNVTVASVPPDLLNLSQGLAGTLIDSIIETRNREDARNGVNVEENRRKRKEKALDDQRLKARRFGSGNLYSEGKCAVGIDVLRRMEDRERLREEKKNQLQEKRLREYRVLRTKVMAIKQLARPHEQLNVAQQKPWSCGTKFRVTHQFHKLDSSCWSGCIRLAAAMIQRSLQFHFLLLYYPSTRNRWITNKNLKKE